MSNVIPFKLPRRTNIFDDPEVAEALRQMSVSIFKAFHCVKKSKGEIDVPQFADEALTMMASSLGIALCFITNFDEGMSEDERADIIDDFNTILLFTLVMDLDSRDGTSLEELMFCEPEETDGSTK